MTVTAFLKTPLFTFDGARSPVPEGAVALTGELMSRGDGVLTLRVQGWADIKGRSLDGTPQTLMLPLGKVDYVRNHEG